MSKRLGCFLASAAVVACLVVPASAATITYLDLGTLAPPGTLGGQSMTPFPDDLRQVFTNITSVPSPLGGSLGFSSTVSLREIGQGWASWSHGYSDDVYVTNGLSLTLTLPAGTTAFYFYAEPNLFQSFNFTATATGGAAFATSGVQPIVGQSGARGFGFFTSDTTIDSISVTTTAAAGGFAVGEFGIASSPVIPEPASMLLLGSGLAGVAALRRRRGARKAK